VISDFTFGSRYGLAFVDRFQAAPCTSLEALAKSRMLKQVSVALLDFVSAQLKS